MKHCHICIGIVALFLSSCSFEASWQETEDNILYWASSHSGRYVWTGNTFYGVANGEGYLNNVNRRGEIKSSTHYYATLGLLNDYDKIILVNSWKYWGDEKEGIPHGLGIIERPDSALVIGRYKNGKSDTVYVFKNDHIIYSGGWKNFDYNGKGILKSLDGHIIYNGRFKDGLYDGNGTLYYDNGQIRYCGHFLKGKYNGRGKLYQQNGKLEYNGHFKEGIYNGYGILYCENDSIVEHVWLNGKINPKYIKLYQKLEEHRDNISSKEYKTFKKHIAQYERFAWLWKGIILCILVLIIYLMIRLYKGNSSKQHLYTSSDPISKKKVYKIWLISGIFGFHRVYLASWVGFVNIGLISIAIILNLTPLTLFAGHYALMPSFIGMTWSFYVALVCVGLSVTIWLIDALWIAYRIYYLTNIYYRHDIRELDILQGRRTDVDRLMDHIAKTLPQLLSEIQAAIADSRGISREQIRHSTKIGKFLKIGEKDLKKSQRSRIYNKVYRIQKCQHQMQEESDALSIYLEEARVSAYRNMLLAKEVIQYFKDNVKSKEQEVHTDEKIQITDIQITNVSQNENITLDVSGAVESFDMAFMTLANSGISGSLCVGIGGVLAIGALAISYLEQRNKVIQQYTQEIDSLIENLNDISKDVVKIESQLLRMNELLKALYQCNKAFISAYTKLRDRVFPAPSFGNFLKGVRLKDEYFSSNEFKHDIVFLIQVCSQYNKVNTADIKH